MLVKFKGSIGSREGWSYCTGQVVRIGEQFTADEVPAEQANQWLESGLLELERDLTGADAEGETNKTEPARRVGRMTPRR